MNLSLLPEVCGRERDELKPSAAQETKLLLIEPMGILNTGDEMNERTAVSDVWID